MPDRREEQRELDALRDQLEALGVSLKHEGCAPSLASMTTCHCGAPFVQVGFTHMHQGTPLERAWQSRQRLRAMGWDNCPRCGDLVPHDNHHLACRSRE